MSIATLDPPPARIQMINENPLTQSHHRELAYAVSRAKIMRKVARVAAFNGWTMAIFAACSLPFAVTSLLNGVMGLGLATLAYNEFRGRRLIGRFNLSAPRLLGWNQIGFMSLIVAYCLWMIVSTLINPSLMSPEVASSLTMMGQSPELLETLVRAATVGTYVILIVLTVIFQGLNAAYYFSRKKHLRAYLDETPPWVIEVQRTMAVA